MNRIVIVDPVDATRAALRDMLLGVDSIWLEAECARYEYAFDVIQLSAPDVVIVSLDADPNRAMQLIAQLSVDFPQMAILVVSADKQAGVKAMQHGAKGVLSQPVTVEDLLGTIRTGPGDRSAASASSRAPEQDNLMRLPPRLDVDDNLDAIESQSSAFGIRKEMVRSLAQMVQEREAKQPEGDGDMPERVRRDRVQCSVFAPPAVRPGDMFLVQVFQHTPLQAEVAASLAREFDDQAERRGFKNLETLVAQGTRLTFHLVMSGLQVDEPVQHQVWSGDAESIQFAVAVPVDRKPGAIIGTLTVSQESVPLGHIKFKLMVVHPAEPSAPSSYEPAGMSANRYRKAFISYASADRSEVLKRVQMLRQLGIEYFQDILDLEPGDRWEKQLYRHIDESDVFLLFWSSAARQSKWVLEEVRYALNRKGADELNPPEIKPIVIEGPPPPPPPDELAHLHFQDYLVYFMVPNVPRPQ